jgi:hypothetical protein
MGKKARGNHLPLEEKARAAMANRLHAEDQAQESLRERGEEDVDDD